MIQIGSDQIAFLFTSQPRSSEDRNYLNSGWTRPNPILESDSGTYRIANNRSAFFVVCVAKVSSETFLSLATSSATY